MEVAKLRGAHGEVVRGLNLQRPRTVGDLEEGETKGGRSSYGTWFMQYSESQWSSQWLSGVRWW